ncbi:MAG: hypothetical protein JXR96_02970 [Deltaproteobacteria bacterium]|nr:hypothetical protein [Deltaproteobacteria bacterium]
MAALDRLARHLGALMIGGSLLGVGVALAAAVVLVALGSDLADWRMGLDGWWRGPHGWLEAIGGAGILVLGATPVVMLVVCGVQALRDGRPRSVLTVLGILSVLAVGICLAWISGP